MSAEDMPTKKQAPDSISADIMHLLRTYWPLFLGNVLEWYEFGIYGYLTSEMKANFFKGSAAATWVAFAVGFIGRPFGGTVLGWVGDTLGRRYATNVSIAGMLLGTVGQGLLPTKSATGVVILIMLRLLQGISAGGEISNVCVYICEVAPSRSMGRAISLVAMTANAGGLCALCLAYLLSSLVGEEAMMTWAWRVPFLFALLPGLVAVWGRRRMPESEVFLQEQATVVAECKVKDPASEPSDASSTCNEPSCVMASTQESARDLKMSNTAELRAHLWGMLISMIGVSGACMQAYLAGVWMTSYLREHGLTAQQSMLVTIVTRSVTLVLSPLVGYFADVKGVGFVMLTGSFALAAGGFPIFYFVQSNPTSFMTAILALGVGNGMILALIGTVLYAFTVELFPTSVRAAANGLSYNVGVSFFGGLVPFLAQMSLQVTSYGPGVLLSCAGISTGGAIVLGQQLQRRGKLQMAHIRPSPYMGTKAPELPAPAVAAVR